MKLRIIKTFLHPFDKKPAVKRKKQGMLFSGVPLQKKAKGSNTLRVFFHQMSVLLKMLFFVIMLLGETMGHDYDVVSCRCAVQKMLEY